MASLKGTRIGGAYLMACANPLLSGHRRHPAPNRSPLQPFSAAQTNVVRTNTECIVPRQIGGLSSARTSRRGTADRLAATAEQADIVLPKTATLEDEEVSFMPSGPTVLFTRRGGPAG
jgi:hypothetical protein